MTDLTHEGAVGLVASAETHDRSHLIAEAEEARVLGRLAEAEALFVAALTTQPARVDAHIGAGRCAWMRGDTNAAYAYFAAAAAEGGNVWPLTHFADDCRKAGLIDQAEHAYRQAAQMMPECSEPVAGLAACARHRGDRDAAVTLQARVCALAPDDRPAHIALASDLHALKRLDEASSILDALLVADPQFLPALTLAVKVARDDGQTEHALHLQQRVEALQPEAPASMIARISAHRERGELELAYALLNRLLARDPNNAPALVQRGLLHRAEGDTGAAIAAFERAYAQDPTDVATILHLVRELHDSGTRQRADSLLALAIRLDTKSVQALSYRAEHALVTEDPATALEAMQTALSRVPIQLGLHLRACAALSQLGRISDALNMIDQAVDRCVPAAILYARRGAMLRQLGRLSEATATLQAGLREFPESFILWEASRHVDIILGDPDACADALAAATFEREGERATVAALQGDLATELGDLTAATFRYEQAASLQPANAVHQANLVRAGFATFDLDLAATGLARLDEIQTPAHRRRHRSTSTTQTFLERVLAHYRADAEPRRLLAAVPLQGPQRMTALAELCRRFPDSTLIAGMLLQVTLGSQPGSPRAMQNTPIPRRIMQYWPDREPPPDLLDVMQSWRFAAADSYVRFDEHTARDFLTEHFTSDVNDAYDRSETPSTRSDLFRLAYLARMGGIHLDAFDRCIGPLEPLLPSGVELVLSKGELGLPSNGFIASVAGHPVLTRALDLAVAAINGGERNLLWMFTGPGLIARCVAQFVADQPSRSGELRVWSRREMFASVALGCLGEWRELIQPRLPRNEVDAQRQSDA